MRVLEYFRGTNMEFPFALGAFCGMRESAIVGLRWDRIGERLTIKEAIVNGINGKCSKLPKSYAGDRSIKIFPFVREIIDRTPQDGEYVTKLSASAIYNRFIRALMSLNNTYNKNSRDGKTPR